MTNTKRSEDFIKTKHTINSCLNVLHLKGTLKMLLRIKDSNEYLVLLQYYEAMEKELELDSLEEKTINK